MQEISTNAVKLIKEYFGETYSLEYEKFYSSLKPELIKTSIKELLTEYLGEEQAIEKLSKNELL